MPLTQARWLPWAMFAGIALVYLSLSPLSIAIMGYMPEFVLAAGQTLHNAAHFLGLNASYVGVDLPRHGMVEVAFELPFVAIGRPFGDAWVDHLVALEPIVETSGICVIIFLWTRQLTNSLKWAYVLTLAAAFTTMLWPYAYIALETTQSFFLLLSGYLSLGSPVRSSRRTLAFALSAAVAVSAKATGVFLVPAVSVLDPQLLSVERRWPCRPVALAATDRLAAVGAGSRAGGHRILDQPLPPNALGCFSSIGRCVGSAGQVKQSTDYGGPERLLPLQLREQGTVHVQLAAAGRFHRPADCVEKGQGYRDFRLACAWGNSGGHFLDYLV